MSRLELCMLLSVALAVPGCALTSNQRDVTGRFALASRDIGEFASKEFTHFRAATIEMNVTSVAIRGKADKANLDEAMDVDAVVARVQAAQALTSYGTLLWALVSETQEAELRQASTNFVDSFQTVSGRTMTDTQLQGLGQTVQAIGSFWVEAEKAKAVKQIVPAASRDVNRLCDLLIADFSTTALQSGQGFDVTIGRLRVDADIALANPATPYNERLIAMRGQKKAQEESEHLQVISSQAIKVLNTLKAANSQLEKAVLDDRVAVSDIQALRTELRSLKTAMDVVTSRY